MLEEGIAEIPDELLTLWQVYVLENPANLTRDASSSIPILYHVLLPGLVLEIQQDLRDLGQLFSGKDSKSDRPITSYFISASMAKLPESTRS